DRARRARARARGPRQLRGGARDAHGVQEPVPRHGPGRARPRDRRGRAARAGGLAREAVPDAPRSGALAGPARPVGPRPARRAREGRVSVLVPRSVAYAPDLMEIEAIVNALD